MIASVASLLPQLQRAQSLVSQGRGGEAWLVLAPLRQAMNGNGQALRLYALTAQGLGRIDEAASALKRILVLENNPPEILGALADMLGEAGRHSEALVHWDRLVALHPELADAHLNRAIAAADSGQHDLAIAAADAGLQRFEGHARLLAVKAMALKNAGRVEEALRGFEKAVAADPERPITRHNQAVALRAVGRFEEACEAYAEAQRLGMRGAQFHANWAAAALEAQRVEEAAELYRKALAEDSGHDESLKGLTRLHIEFGTEEDPFSHYADLARNGGDRLDVWLAWANALAQHHRYEVAAEVAAEAAARFPDDPVLPIVRTFSGGMAGDALRAARQLGQWYAADPDNEFLWATLSQVALRASLPELAAETAGRLSERYPYHQTAWSILSLAWRLLDDPREYWLCDYDRFVMAVEVPPPGEEGTAEGYAMKIAAVLGALHTTLEAPGDQSLREGTQTRGALFEHPDPEIGLFRKAISDAAAGAINRLPDDPGHPFLSRKASRFRFSGSWSVRLKAGGGHHVPHFHSEGWMSSAYYARLPVIDDRARKRQEGWIEFGRPPQIFGLDLSPRRTVEPREGLLVLFPSYMWHGTIPFAVGDRLTAAFDYLPAD